MLHKSWTNENWVEMVLKKNPPWNRCDIKNVYLREDSQIWSRLVDPISWEFSVWMQEINIVEGSDEVEEVFWIEDRGKSKFKVICWDRWLNKWSDYGKNIKNAILFYLFVVWL